MLPYPRFAVCVQTAVKIDDFVGGGGVFRLRRAEQGAHIIIRRMVLNILRRIDLNQRVATVFLPDGVKNTVATVVATCTVCGLLPCIFPILFHYTIALFYKRTGAMSQQTDASLNTLISASGTIAGMGLALVGILAAKQSLKPSEMISDDLFLFSSIGFLLVVVVGYTVQKNSGRPYVARLGDAGGVDFFTVAADGGCGGVYSALCRGVKTCPSRARPCVDAAFGHGKSSLVGLLFCFRKRHCRVYAPKGYRR
ncbi:hypothetical protein HMPREF9120_00150, partial [Neisseria sp. oral taxon 020 str. F0370]